MSMVGDQVTTVAVPLTAVLALHAGAAAMGYLTALEWLPSLLFGMHAGAWADRHGRRRQLMIACDLGRCALLATVPVCWALGVLTLWQLLAVVFAAGTLSILFNVADATMFVSIVAPAQYVDGQSLIYGSRAMSFVVGPSLGGLLTQLLTAPFALVDGRAVVPRVGVLPAADRPGRAAGGRREGRRHRGAAVHRPLPRRPGLADRRGGGQLLQPDVLRARAAVRGAVAARQRRAARAHPRLRRRRRAARRGADQGDRRPDRRGARLRRRLLRLHRPAGAGAARARPRRARDRLGGRARCCSAPSSCPGSGSWCSTSRSGRSSPRSSPTPCGPGSAGRSPRSTTGRGRWGRCSAGCSGRPSGCGPRCGWR